MKKLLELEARLDNITFGDLGEDLFGYLQDFFSQDEVKDRMIYLNQEQLYEHQITSYSAKTPRYSPYTIRRKGENNLKVATNFLYHETGELYRSMGVLVGPESVQIVSTNDTSITLNEDFMEGTMVSMGEDEHIEDFWNIYDPERKGLGLTDENFLSLKEDIDGFVRERLKNYIVNG